MTRALLITSIWLLLAALVAGVAHLARPCCCDEAPDRAPAHLSLEPATRSAPAITLLPVQSVEPGSTASPAASAHATPSTQSPLAVAASLQEVGASTATAPPAASRQEKRPEPGQKPPAPRDPDDEDEPGGIHGLGRLPKGVDPEYEGLGVMCISRATGRPISEVRVRAYIAKDLDAWSAQHAGRAPESEDPDVVLESAPEEGKTNAWGITITQSAPGRMLVDARLGALYGFAWVDRNTTSQVRLALVEDHDLVLQARTTDGKPLAGVPVVVRDASCTDVWHGVTQGDSGEARMRHAAFLLDRDACPGPCTALVEGVSTAAAPVEVARANLPAEPVVLAVTPAQKLRVRVHGPDGALVKDLVDVSLSLAGDGRCNTRLARSTKSGEVLFERVDPGLKSLVVTADGGDVFEPVTSAAQTTAAKPGEEQVVDLSFKRRYPRVRMVLADGAGKPLAHARSAAWLETAGAPGYASLRRATELESGADGSLVIPISAPAGSARALLVMVRDAAGDWFGTVRVPLDADFTTGDRDAGAQRVRELPVIAQGYVLDERDAPVPEATVEIAASNDPALDLESFPVDPRWTIASDARGRFKVRGELAGSRVAITASAVDHVRPPRALVGEGKLRVQLTLVRCAVATGKVMLPVGMPASLVSLRIEVAGEAIPVSIGASELFRVAGLTPGPIRLVATVQGMEAPAYDVPDIELKPGVDSADPRVTLVDLRNRVPWVNLRVLDADGQPIDEAAVDVLDGGKRRFTIPVKNSVAGFLAKAGGVDVEVRASGYETLAMQSVESEAEARLVRTRK